MTLAGRVAVVTGGASGIGAACASALTEHGVRVVTWDVAPGADVRCDVSDPESVRAALDATTAAAGPPTLLVAAAGVGRGGLILDEDPAAWDAVFAVNVRGVLLSLQAVARSAAATGQGGSAVLVSSVNGRIADPGTAAYAASKAAVNQLARVAAVELGRYGFRVNAVAPGPTDTAMLAALTAAPGFVEEVAAATPLGRIGTPADIADAVIALLAAQWVTGQVLEADGGAAQVTARGRARLARQQSAGDTVGPAT